MAPATFFPAALGPAVIQSSRRRNRLWLATRLGSCLLLGCMAPGLAVAQAPPPGLPVVPGPIDQPALWAQPLYERPGQPRKGSRGAPNSQPAAPEDPEIAGELLSGSDLQAAVAKVNALPWHVSLPAAMAESAATGKPIFWLQALGELDGLASSTLQSLRGLTLANDVVLQRLREQFVLGKSNSERMSHVGVSAGYDAQQTAMGSTNGAGGRNAQLVFLAADGTVLLVLPGYWHALDLLAAMQLGQELYRLHGSREHTLEQKLFMADVVQKSFLARVGAAARARTAWTPDDVAAEQQRNQRAVRDTVQLDEKDQPVRRKDGSFELRPLLDVIHGRLRAEPFRAFATYPWEHLVDYGRPQYDSNAPVERGRPFPAAVANQQRRERELKAAR